MSKLNRSFNFWSTWPLMLLCLSLFTGILVILWTWWMWVLLFDRLYSFGWLSNQTCWSKDFGALYLLNADICRSTCHLIIYFEYDKNDIRIFRVGHNLSLDRCSYHCWVFSVETVQSTKPKFDLARSEEFKSYLKSSSLAKVPIRFSPTPPPPLGGFSYVSKTPAQWSEQRCSDPIR